MSNQSVRSRGFWTVRRRLLSGYAIEVVITLLLGGYALTRLGVIKQDSVQLLRGALPGIVLVNQLDSKAARVHGLILGAVTAPGGADADRLSTLAAEELDRLGHLVRQFEDAAAQAQGHSGPEMISVAHAAYLSVSTKLIGSAAAPLADRHAALQRDLEPAYRRLQDAIRLAGDLKRTAAEVAGAQIQGAVTGAEAGIVAGICASVMIVVISGYFLAKAIHAPLVGLTDAMERMRRGDFTLRLKAERPDEFGELASGFNHMADSLGAVVGQVQKSGILVNASAQQLSASAQQQESGAQQTAATTVEIGATAKQISETSQELVATVKQVASVAEQTAVMAGNGQNGLLRMQETMLQVMGAASGISGKLTVLNDKAGSISQVVTTITKVADQTNLLSLNAAIEAEKAGEYGRGFAVVATEIRRLADQTAVASHDIEQTVKEMQSAVSGGVMSVDKFSEEVRRGVQEVNQVGSQLNEIIREVQALTPRFESVNEGMQMHAVGAQQISISLVQLGESTQRTADSLRQSNTVIEQLNEATRTLRASVSQFKLEAASNPAFEPTTPVPDGWEAMARRSPAPAPSSFVDM